MGIYFNDLFFIFPFNSSSSKLLFLYRLPRTIHNFVLEIYLDINTLIIMSHIKYMKSKLSV